MSHESHLGPTCGAVTAQKKKAGVGLLLNGVYLTRSWIFVSDMAGPGLFTQLLIVGGNNNIQ